MLLPLDEDDRSLTVALRFKQEYFAVAGFFLLGIVAQRKFSCVKFKSNFFWYPATRRWKAKIQSRSKLKIPCFEKDTPKYQNWNFKSLNNFTHASFLSVPLLLQFPPNDYDPMQIYFFLFKLSSLLSNCYKYRGSCIVETIMRQFVFTTKKLATLVQNPEGPPATNECRV